MTTGQTDTRIFHFENDLDYNDDRNHNDHSHDKSNDNDDPNGHNLRSCSLK